MTIQTQNTSKHNLQIQSIRGLFCLMIVLYHMTCRYSSIYGNEQFKVACFESLSLIALIGFFCISGYYSDGRLLENGFIYFCRKFYRLYPAYFVSISVIFLAQLTGLLGPARSTTFTQYLLNIPFLNVALHTRYVDGAHWYVAFLILLHSFCCILRLLKIYQYNLFPILNISAVLFFTILLINYPDYGKIHDYLNYYCSFSIGIGFRRYNKDDRRKYLALLTILSACYVFAFNNIYQSILICVTLLTVVLSLNEQLFWLEKTRCLQFFGERSYMIYLIHQNIGFMIINSLINNGVKDVMVCVILSSITSISLGIIIYKMLKHFSLPC